MVLLGSVLSLTEKSDKFKLLNGMSYPVIILGLKPIYYLFVLKHEMWGLAGAAGHDNDQ